MLINIYILAYIYILVVNYFYIIYQLLKRILL